MASTETQSEPHPQRGFAQTFDLAKRLFSAANSLRNNTTSCLRSSALTGGQNSTFFPLAICCVLFVFAMTWLIVKTFNFIAAFLCIPGPACAKLTVLWKLFHTRKGTYDSRIRKLHAKHGAVVQVGPYEYSVSDPAYFERCAKFQKTVPLYSTSDGNVQPDAHHLFRDVLTMANIFYCETDIEACNLKLLDTFAKYAATGETVKVSDIIAYYAYDVLYATTTGRQPGFLGRPMHMRKVTSALESWKSYGVLYGSYLRFRPFLDAAYKKLGLAGNAKDHISEDFDIDDDHPKHLLRKGSDEPKHARDMFDPCVAMILAGSDPVITHLLTSLFYIYRDPELLQRLRHEIKRSGIWQPPRLKFLMRSKARMPLLHAVLQETLRLHQPQTTGFSYIASEGGVLIEGKHVPEGCTICLEPSVAHVNPDIFGADGASLNPARWFQDLETVGKMRNHILAFGAGSTQCPGKELHIALITKILVQILPNIDLNMAAAKLSIDPTAAKFFSEAKECQLITISLPPASTIKMPSSPLRPTAPAFAPETTTAPELPPVFSPTKRSFNPFELAANGFDYLTKYMKVLKVNKTFIPNAAAHGTEDVADDANAPQASPTFSDAPTLGESGISDEDRDILGNTISRKTTDFLLKIFPPTQQDLAPHDPVITSWQLYKKSKRYAAHQAIDRVWGGRLEHVIRPDSRMVITLCKTSAPDLRYDTQAGLVQAGSQPIVAPAQKRLLPSDRTINQAWTGFATTEGARFDTFDEIQKKEAADAEKWQQAKKQREEDYAQRQAVRAAAPQSTFKQTFKQTSREETEGKLGGPRKFLNVVKTEHAVDGTATLLEAGDETATTIEEVGETVQPVKVEKAKAKTNFVPPHLRARSLSPNVAQPNESQQTTIDGVLSDITNMEAAVECEASSESKAAVEGTAVASQELVENATSNGTQSEGTTGDNAVAESMAIVVDIATTTQETTNGVFNEATKTEVATECKTTAESGAAAAIPVQDAVIETPTDTTESKHTPGDKTTIETKADNEDIDANEQETVASVSSSATEANVDAGDQTVTEKKHTAEDVAADSSKPTSHDTIADDTKKSATQGTLTAENKPISNVTAIPDNKPDTEATATENKLVSKKRSVSPPHVRRALQAEAAKLNGTCEAAKESETTTKQTVTAPGISKDADVSEAEDGGVAVEGGHGWVAAKMPTMFT